MTVDELITRLQEISSQGKGDYIACSACLAWELDTIQTVDKEKTVYID